MIVLENNEFTTLEQLKKELTLTPILEIGCGNGHFLVEEAKKQPNFFFIGCDIKKSRIEKTRSKIKQLNLTNVLAMHMRGEDLLDSFSDNSIDGFYMNFPDPWWKKRYHKRRFFYLQSDVDKLVKKLKPEGFISFISDHKEYFNHVFSLLSYNRDLSPLFAEGFIETKTTDYNTMFSIRWEKAGRSFFQTKFKKICIQ